MTFPEQRYEVWPIEAPLDHPDNPRRGDTFAITESIETTGFYGAIIVQESTSRIIAGAHRRRAARLAGETSIPVMVLDCDDATALGILLADNRISDLARYDDDALVALLAAAAEAPLGLGGTGWYPEDVAALVSRVASGVQVGTPPTGPGTPPTAPSEGTVPTGVGTRQVILRFEAEEYLEVVGLLGDYCGANGLPDASAAVFDILGCG